MLNPLRLGPAERSFRILKLSDQRLLLRLSIDVASRPPPAADGTFTTRP
jgi:hypothetical protein